MMCPVGLMRQNGIPALFHQPFWRTGSSADAYGLGLVKPAEVDLLRTLDLMAVGVDGEALVEEYLAVAALAAADKEDNIVVLGKLGDVGHAVGHLTTDGVEAAEGRRGGNVVLDVVDDAVKLVEALRRLRVEIDVAVEVEMLHVVELLDDDGVLGRLAYESEHLSVSVFTEDNDLSCWVIVVLLLDAALQGEDHGAGGIDDLDVVLPGDLVGGGWLAVGTEQHLGVMELLELLVVDGDKTVVVKPFHLHAIVNDVAETVERLARSQFFFRFADGCSHAEAEAAAGIYFYFEVHKSCLFAVLIILR